MTGTLYIVDGYNVLHALFRDAGKDEIFARRDWLADRLAGFAALNGAKAVLVYDGHGPESACGVPVKGGLVEVCYAGGRLTADALIARRIAAREADVHVVVVSADQEVQLSATRAGVSRMTPSELGSELRVEREALDSSRGASTMPSRLEDKVDPETLRKLQELRDQRS